MLNWLLFHLFRYFRKLYIIYYARMFTHYPIFQVNSILMVVTACLLPLQEVMVVRSSPSRRAELHIRSHTAAELA